MADYVAACAVHNNEAGPAPFPRVKLAHQLEAGLCKILLNTAAVEKT